MGLNYVPYTSACVYALDGRLLARWPVGDYFISAVTQIELLARPGLTPAEEWSIRTLVAPMTLIELPQNVREEAARIRRDHGLKLPDAIIAATALTLEAELLSKDRQMARVPSLVVTPLALKP